MKNGGCLTNRKMTPRGVKAVFSCILALALWHGAGVFCYAGQVYQASVEDLCGAKYLPRVQEALAQAKCSIDVVMYFIDFDPKDEKSPVYVLVRELADAAKRGVKVRVILDRSLGFNPGEDIRKNLNAQEYLQQRGVEVLFDATGVTTHAKAVVIDDELVILGSANWSEAAFGRNNETNCLVRSPELALRFKSYFAGIKLDEKAGQVPAGSVLLDSRFLTMPAGAGLFADASNHAFNLYLLLLKSFDGNPDGRVPFDREDLAARLGLPRTLSGQRDVDWALHRLEKAGLVSRVKRIPLPPLVCLLDYSGRGAYSVPRENFAAIPREYWLWGWDKKLSFPEKYCYFINLIKARTGPGGVRWSSFQRDVLRQFCLKQSSFSKGMGGLRRLDIIDIDYPAFVEGGFVSKCEPTVYTLRGLYDPSALQQKKQLLARQYGEENFRLALGFSAIVFCENDPDTLEDILKRMAACGNEKVARAFAFVADRRETNPKRSYAYVLTCLNNL